MVCGMYSFFIFLYYSLNVYAGWELPNAPISGVGDAGSFYLNSAGVTFHLHNNDYLGETDKLMTGSSGLFFYGSSKNKKHGVELSLQRRLITPIIKTRHAKPIFSPPKGVYADQAEVRLAYSYLNKGIKLELAADWEHYSDLKGDRILRFLHDLSGSNGNTDQFGHKVRNDYFSGAVGIGYLASPFLFMVYFRESPIMRDAISRLNMTLGGNVFQFALQGEVSRQVQSDFYKEDIEDWRYSYGLSFKWHWYQMSVNYVSSYLQYDKYGQYYISPFIVSYEF